MKKGLLYLAALLMFPITASAQHLGKVARDTDVKSFFQKSPWLGAMPVRKAQSAVNKIALDENERIMGYYDSDDLDYTSATRLTSAGTYKIGCEFTPEILNEFIGSEMTKVRFGLGASIGATMITILSVDFDGYVQDTLVTVDVPNTVQGWNDVTLPEPIRIQENLDYLICYDYVVTSGSDAPWAILLDVNLGVQSYDGGFVGFGDWSGYGEEYSYWYNFSNSGYGNVCIQAVVRGGDFLDDDITLNSLSTDNLYAKVGEPMSFTYGIKNFGNNIPSSYTLNVSVDGELLGTISTPAELTGVTQKLTSTVTLPADLRSGSHRLNLSVADINGNVPTEGTSDDEVRTYFYAYPDSVKRQKNLIEEFSSTTCKFCPLGHELMKAIEGVRDDIALAVLHNSNPSSSSLKTMDTDSLSLVLCYGVGSNPSAVFNRYYIDDTSINPNGGLILPIGYDSYLEAYAEMFSDIIDMTSQMPAFASIDISTLYREDAHQLDITVSGKVVDGFDYYVGDDAILTVYLTESNFVAPQTTPTGSVNRNYVHHDVVRSIASNKFGDVVSWVEGQEYSKSYAVSLDREWNANEMKVVAFISKPILDDPNAQYWENMGLLWRNYPDELWVNNANVVKVSDGQSTSINGVATEAGVAEEVARYTLDGTKVTAPVKGINIIKMSDGTTRKVVVY